MPKGLEIDQNNLHMKISALNVDFSSLRLNHLGSRRVAQTGIKEEYPFKSGYLSVVGLSRVKIVADRHKHAALS